MNAPLRRSAPLLLSVALIAAAPTPAPAAEATADCVRLVAKVIERFDRSAVSKLHEQVQVYRVTRTMMDALGQKVELGKGWKEGNASWEEAYALFQPDMFAGMRAAAEREMRRQEAKVPALLEGATCTKHLALLDTKAGAAAARLEDAKNGREFLASIEKTFGIPPRLKAAADAARRELAEAAKTPEDPGVVIARATLTIYGKKYLEALKRSGGPDAEVERKATGEAAAAMMAKNRAPFDEIVRRFKAAKGT